MSHRFKLSRRIARLRAPVLTLSLAALFGCDNADSFNPDSSLQPDAADEIALDPLAGLDEATPIAEDEISFTPAETLVDASASFAGGIPIGVSSQPTSSFGSRYNGALLNIWPAYLKRELEQIKRRGGKVVLTFSGNHRHYVDGRGHFSLSKWKDRVANFRSVNFSSYIKDGTIIGHYLIDEPNDASNFGGKAVSPGTVEEMAKYSKSLWPDLPTIVRAAPDYMNDNHRYLDAAWAQYLYRRGNVRDYIRKQISAAQKRGLALVVGLNVLHGGSPNGSKMTANEIREWGSELLESSYPCAFISWQHNSYLSSGDVERAMSDLRRKAENRGSKSCRGG
jgi:hypothetical protein